MTKTQKAKIITIRSLVFVLSISFGLLIAAQLRTIPERVDNPIVPYTSLKETRDDLYKEQKQLKTEIETLQKSINEIQQQKSETLLTKEDLVQLNSKKAQAGVLKLNGPGVIIKLDDSSNNPSTDESIIHASDLRDLVNYLWENGAEATMINRQRIVVNTAIDCIVNTILINNVRLSDPYQIEAIGNQEQMYNGISTSLLLKNLRNRNKSTGLVFQYFKNNNITIDSFTGSFEINTTTN